MPHTERLTKKPRKVLFKWFKHIFNGYLTKKSRGNVVAICYKKRVEYVDPSFTRPQFALVLCSLADVDGLRAASAL